MKPTKILYVEDEASSVLFVKATLEPQGYKIINVKSGEEGWQKYQEEHWPLIILDWVLPKLSGLELCQKIRSLPNGDLPVILIITSKNDTKSLEKILAVGADDYLSKPIDFELLKIRIAIAAQRVQNRIEIREAQLKIATTAYIHPISLVPNREYMLNILQVACKRKKEKDETNYIVFFLDLNKFKNLSETLGPLKGDYLLSRVASILTSYLIEKVEIQNIINGIVDPDKASSLNSISHFGEDEFVILFDNIISFKESATLASELNEIMLRPFYIGDIEIDLASTIGIAEITSETNHASEIIHNANVAFRFAHSKRNTSYHLFDQSVIRQMNSKMQAEADLKRAIKNNELFIELQPIISAQTLETAGYEALVRWNHPNGHVVPPGDFINIAEESGLIIPMTDWILRNICQLLSGQLQTLITEKFISINISATHFSVANFPSYISSIFREYSIAPSLIHLELTERIMANHDQTNETLNQLRKDGINISIDDFGTGYSSLSYLKSLPIDTLKIDRGFVTNLYKDRNNASITRSIIELAKNFKLKTIAEGVETIEEVNFLKELHCDFFQGYYFSKPLSIENIIKRHHNNNSPKNI